MIIDEDLVIQSFRNKFYSKLFGGENNGRFCRGQVELY